MRILNLFAGIGGNRTEWGNYHKITTIEKNSDIAEIYKERFPQDKLIITDAYKYLEDNYNEFDFIWASPPCTSHTKLSALPNYRKRLPDLRLYSIIIFLKKYFKGNWIVENVISYYKPLIHPTALVDRHYIWSNVYIEDRSFSRSGNIKDLGIKKLCELHQVDIDLINTFKPKSWSNHAPKRQILRNCVLPAAGKYILDCISNQTQTSIGKYIRKVDPLRIHSENDHEILTSRK